MFDLLSIKEEITCKGLYYRCRITYFLNGKGHYLAQERFIPLKRKSCKGCEHCSFILEQLQEDVLDVGISVDSLENGAIYYLSCTNGPVDWESGFPDSCELEFKKCGDKI